MTRLIQVVLGSVAALLGFVGAWRAFTAADVTDVVLGVAIHLVAAWLASWSAVRGRLRRGRVAERDAVLITASFAPLFGPALAWLIPNTSARAAVVNAHEAMLEYSEHVMPAVRKYERNLFTGDFDHDLARELDAESFLEVLRHGEIGQKRNALRRLAERGEPRHFEMIRSCLTDPDHEVRLYAYGEIDRCARRHEADIAAATEAAAGAPSRGDLKRRVAEAHRRLAKCGALDQDTGRFHLNVARKIATEARAGRSSDAEAVLLEALAHADLGERAAAEQLLGELSAGEGYGPDLRVANAELAFRRRDFETVRSEARALVELGEEVPEWMAALLEPPPVGVGRER